MLRSGIPLGTFDISDTPKNNEQHSWMHLKICSYIMHLLFLGENKKFGDCNIGVKQSVVAEKNGKNVRL